MAGLLIGALLVGAGIDQGAKALVGSQGHVTLKSVTPGGLEKLRMRLEPYAAPIDCRIPLHVSRCPISQASAEAAATSGLKVQQPKVIESVLANVVVPGSVAPNGIPLSGVMWVVSLDRTTRFAPSCPCCPPRLPSVMIWCAPVHQLVFVDAMSGAPRLITARP